VRRKSGISKNRSWKVISGEVKWNKVKGIRSEEEIGYFQEQELESDK
jgi:hypothetical protein